MGTDLQFFSCGKEVISRLRADECLKARDMLGSTIPRNTSLPSARASHTCSLYFSILIPVDRESSFYNTTTFPFASNNGNNVPNGNAWVVEIGT
jgi:hypothetical protein